jgi:hypothetical protein
MTNLPGTPTVQQLRRFAAENPFPPEWLDGDEEDLFYKEPVMIYFCPCASDRQWQDPVTAIVRCDCGRILKPMTATEHAEAVAQHEATESA